MSNTPDTTINDFISGVIERVRNPFILSFTVAFFTYHFDAFVYLKMTQDIPDVSIANFFSIMGYSDAHNTFVDIFSVFTVPVFFALAFTLVWPLVDGYFIVLRLIIKNHIDRKKKNYISEMTFTAEQMEGADKEVEVAKKQMFELKQELSTAKTKVEEYREQLDSSIIEIARKSALSARLSSEVEEAQEKMRNFRNKFTNSQEALSKYEREKQSNNSAIYSLRLEIKDKAEKLEKVGEFVNREKLENEALIKILSNALDEVAIKNYINEFDVQDTTFYLSQTAREKLIPSSS